MSFSAVNHGNCEVCNSAFEGTAWFGVLRCKCEQECLCSLCVPRVVRCKQVNMHQHITSAAHVKRSTTAAKVLPNAPILSACAIPIMVPKVEVVDLDSDEEVFVIPEEVLGEDEQASGEVEEGELTAEEENLPACLPNPMAARPADWADTMALAVQISGEDLIQGLVLPTFAHPEDPLPAVCSRLARGQPLLPHERNAPVSDRAQEMIRVISLHLEAAHTSMQSMLYQEHHIDVEHVLLGVKRRADDLFGYDRDPKH